jgi:hypothetical protein
MCENCIEHKAVLIEEIRLLASHEGSIFNEMRRLIDRQLEVDSWFKDSGQDIDYIRSEILDAAIAQAIAIRAAFIAHYCDSKVEEGKVPPAMILGIWAGRCLSAELDLADMQNRLGMGNN